MSKLAHGSAILEKITISKNIQHVKFGPSGRFLASFAYVDFPLTIKIVPKFFWKIIEEIEQFSETLVSGWFVQNSSNLPLTVVANLMAQIGSYEPYSVPIVKIRLWTFDFMHTSPNPAVLQFCFKPIFPAVSVLTKNSGKRWKSLKATKTLISQLCVFRLGLKFVYRFACMFYDDCHRNLLCSSKYVYK